MRMAENVNEFENQTLKSLEGDIRGYMMKMADSLWEIGRRLRYIRDKGLVKQGFAAWVEAQGMTYDTANRLLYIVDHLPRLEPYQHLGLTALYLVASIAPEDRWGLKHLPGGVDKYLYEMTVSELRYFKHQLREAKQEAIPQLTTQQPAVPSAPATSSLATTADIQSRLEQVIAERDAMIEQLKATIQHEREEAEKSYKTLAQQYGYLNQFRKGLSHVARHTTTFMPDLEAVQRAIDFAREVDYCLARLGSFRFDDGLEGWRNHAVADSYRHQVARVQAWVQSMQEMLGASEASVRRDVTPEGEGLARPVTPGPVICDAEFEELPDSEGQEPVPTPAERQAQLEAGYF